MGWRELPCARWESLKDPRGRFAGKFDRTMHIAQEARFPFEKGTEMGKIGGMKSFCAAGVTISGIELTEKIRKGQFKIGKLGGSKATMPEIWRTALAA